MFALRTGICRNDPRYGMVIGYVAQCGDHPLEFSRRRWCLVAHLVAHASECCTDSRAKPGYFPVWQKLSVTRFVAHCSQFHSECLQCGLTGLLRGASLRCVWDTEEDLGSRPWRQSSRLLLTSLKMYRTERLYSTCGITNDVYGCSVMADCVPQPRRDHA